jgi:hypothetical protein
VALSSTPTFSKAMAQLFHQHYPSSLGHRFPQSLRAKTFCSPRTVSPFHSNDMPQAEANENDNFTGTATLDAPARVTCIACGWMLSDPNFRKEEPRYFPPDRTDRRIEWRQENPGFDESPILVSGVFDLRC